NIKGPRYEHYPEMLYWDRTLWEMACALGPSLKKESNRYPKRLLLFKEIFMGHTPVTRVGRGVPTQFANVWNVDTGAAFKGPVSVLHVETKQYYQSRPLYRLYPNEPGRN
ncbi:MAG: serine/threonine protein phosphatase, partial [Marinirhabdus sp.]